MRFGFVLPVYIYNTFRQRLAQASFASLARSLTDGLEQQPVLLFVEKNEPETGDVVSAASFPGFEVLRLPEPHDAASIDGCLLYGFSYLAERFPEVSHFAMLTNDWVYNREWLYRLKEIIERHPDAKAWWVYRSAFEKFHKTLRIEDDVLVRSMNAGGCFPREGFDSYPDYHVCRIDSPRISKVEFDEVSGAMDFSFGEESYRVENGDRTITPLLSIQHGLTMDLYDAWLRQGERWVTKRSYILNLGVHGINQQPEFPEYAVDFVGEEG